MMKQKESNGFKMSLSIIFLILIILSTIGIYSYNVYIEGDNKKIQGRIAEKDVEISNIKKNEYIKVYALLEDNKKTLDKLKAYSQIKKFVNGITYIEDNYDFILEGFNYSNGILTTKAITDPEKISKPYVAVTKFIKEYRRDYKKVAFKLPFISKVSGIRKMTFNLKLEVK